MNKKVICVDQLGNAEQSEAYKCVECQRIVQIVANDESVVALHGNFSFAMTFL